MLEYIFFDEGLRRRFVEFARSRGASCQESGDGMGLVAAVAEDLTEEADAALEQFYDQLQEEQAALTDRSEGGLKKHGAGVEVTLGDGRPCLVRLSPEMANRLLACFSPQELHELVSAIARSVETPSAGPVCRG